MKTRTLVPTLLVLAAPLAAQNARPVQQLNPGQAGGDAFIAGDSSGDLSVAQWQMGNSSGIYVAVSDGRGVNWSAPLRVDTDVTGALKNMHTESVKIAGDDVYVIWRDDRNSLQPAGDYTDLAFVRSTDRGVTFSSETWLPKGTPLGSPDLRDHYLAVSDDPAGDHLYAAMATNPTNNADEILYVTSSHDGGVTWSAAVEVPVGGSGHDVDDIDVGCDGTTVHVVWLDDRNVENDLYYQRSTDGGVTWLPADVLLSDPLGVGVDGVKNGIDIQVRGDVVAVGWPGEPGGNGHEDLWINVSTNAGTTWNGPLRVRDDVADVDNLRLAVGAGGAVAVAWEDDRNGSDDVFVAVSTDGGLSMGGEHRLSAGTSRSYGLEAHASSPGIFAAAWNAVGPPDDAMAAFTRDTGASWTSLTVADGIGDVDVQVMAMDDRYGSVITIMEGNTTGTNQPYAGGYRPQTVTAVNFVQGQPANFRLANWDPAPAFVWVLLSANLGTFPLGFGDGRDVGLHPAGSLFNLSLTGTPAFVQVLSGGSAITSPLNYNKPPGFTFYHTAVSFTLAPITIRELADAIEEVGL